jgi:hypothetical protein
MLREGKGDLESGKRKLEVVYSLWLKKKYIDKFLLLPLVGAIENVRDILNIWSLGVFTVKHLRNKYFKNKKPRNLRGFQYYFRDELLFSFIHTFFNQRVKLI